MLPSAAAHRRYLHQMPELGEPFFQTLTLVAGVLRGYRCPYFSPMPGCLCAWFDFGREETVAFRAALDGVAVEEATGLPYSSRTPGCSHASGHDGEIAMALDLCQWLAGRGKGSRDSVQDRDSDREPRQKQCGEPDREQEPDGELCRELDTEQDWENPPRNVLVIFQPQAGDGAKQLCASNLFTEYRVTRLYGLRLWPGVPQGSIASRPGALMARSNEVTVRIEGRTAHFARFQEGSDALLGAAQFLRRAYAMLDNIPNPRVLRFGKMASGRDRFTVSPETILEGNMLTYREEAFEAIRVGLKRVSREVEAETGCVSSVWISEGWPAVWNDEAFYAAVCGGLGTDAPVELDQPALESDDFSIFQKYVPALLFFLGTGRTPEPRSPAFNFDAEAVLPAGVEFLKKLARLA